MRTLDQVFLAKRVRLRFLESLRRARGPLCREADEERQQLARFVAWADGRGRSSEVRS